MLGISRILVGLLLLVLGRRLYWLFVAGIGLLAGLELAPRLLPRQPDTVIVLVALGLAVVGALIAVVASEVVVGIIGFAAAGGIAVLLVRNLGIRDGLVTLGAGLIAGIVGALLSIAVLDWALIVLSSLAGASLLAEGAQRLLAVPPLAGSVLVIVLAAIGTLLQARALRQRTPRSGSR